MEKNHFLNWQQCNEASDTQHSSTISQLSPWDMPTGLSSGKSINCTSEQRPIGTWHPTKQEPLYYFITYVYVI